MVWRPLRISKDLFFLVLTVIFTVPLQPLEPFARSKVAANFAAVFG